MTWNLAAAYLVLVIFGAGLYAVASWITVEKIAIYRGMERTCTKRIQERDAKIEELSERLELRDETIRECHEQIHGYKETIRNKDQIIGGLRYDIDERDATIAALKRREPH
jgi:chromosome segregation ATPase